MAPSASLHFTRVVRWAFYLFVFSLPFEYPDRSIPIEIPTITASIFLLATWRQPRLLFKEMSWGCLWFLGYLYTFVLSFALSAADYPDEVVKLFLLLLQAVLVFWAAFNILRDERLASVALWTLGVACLIRAVLQFAGVDAGVHAADRQSALGQNMNMAANIMSVGLLTLIGLAYNRKRRSTLARWVVWPMVAALGLAIVQTGSRGGILALLAGLLTMSLSGRTLGAQVRNVCVTLCAVALLAWIGLTSDMLMKRVTQAEQGNLAGREAIFPTAWQMFQEKPLTGWGPIKNKYELGARLPWQGHPRRDAHNLVLELLTATGIVGAIPFLIGVGVCMRSAWVARKGAEGMLPSTLLAAMLVGNMSGNYIAAKVFWFVLAYAVASRSQRAADAVQRSIVQHVWHRRTV